jgi:hypothetical protein
LSGRKSQSPDKVPGKKFGPLWFGRLNAAYLFLVGGEFSKNALEALYLPNVSKSKPTTAADFSDQTVI